MNTDIKKHFQKYKHYDFSSGGVGNYLRIDNYLVEEQIVDARPFNAIGRKYPPHNEAFIEFLQCSGNGSGDILSKDNKTFSCRLAPRWDKEKDSWSISILLYTKIS